MTDYLCSAHGGDSEFSGNFRNDPDFDYGRKPKWFIISSGFTYSTCDTVNYLPNDKTRRRTKRVPMYDPLVNHSTTLTKQNKSSRKYGFSCFVVFFLVTCTYGLNGKVSNRVPVFVSDRGGPWWTFSEFLGIFPPVKYLRVLIKRKFIRRDLVRSTGRRIAAYS